MHVAHIWDQIAVDGQHIALDVHQLSDNRVICCVECVEDTLEAPRGLLFSENAFKTLS